MAGVDVTPEEFKLFSNYIFEISGIWLETGKEYLLKTRLGPILEKYNCPSYTVLYKKARLDTKKEIEGAIVDAISTNETYFFRDKAPFELLQHKILPDLIDRRSKRGSGLTPSIRLWSAACSTGQEIYSIAMALTEMGVTMDKYNIKLLGTDISNAAVAQASYGIYNKFEVSRGLDKKRLERFFEKQGDKYRIKDQIRAMAQFKTVNLTKPFPNIGTFDIILLRNVLIYFASADRRKIYANISKVLAPDGYLLIGSTESLINETDLFQSRRYLRSVFYQFKQFTQGAAS